METVSHKHLALVHTAFLVPEPSLEKVIPTFQDQILFKNLQKVKLGNKTQKCGFLSITRDHLSILVKRSNTVLSSYVVFE